MSLRRNISSLFLVQGINYILPLVVFPYLVRTLGIAGFGRFNFVFSCITYLTLLADYGFNLTATHRASIVRDDRVAMGKLIASVTLVKLLLALGGGLVGFGLLLVSSRLAIYRELFLLAYLTVVSTAFSPLWVFQGTESAHRTIVPTLVGKMASLAFLLLMVRGPGDIGLAVLGQSLSNLIPVVILWWTVLFGMKLRPLAVGFDEIRTQFKEGAHAFGSSAAVSLYTNTNIVVLGWVAGEAAVGIYTAADKIKVALMAVLAPVTQAVYPRSSACFARSTAEGMRFIARFAVVFIPANIVLSILIFFLSDKIVHLIYGAPLAEVAACLTILSSLPLALALSNLFGVQIMFPVGLRSLFLKSVFLAGVFNLAIIFPLAKFMAAQGVACAVVATEFFVALIMYTFLKRSRILK